MYTCECSGPWHSVGSDKKYDKNKEGYCVGRYIKNIFCPWAWRDILAGESKIIKIDFPVIVTQDKFL